MGWSRTNAFPHDKPWGKGISQPNTNGVCFFNGFSQHNPSCSFLRISRDANRTSCTSECAASCISRLYCCLPTVPSVMHTLKCWVTPLPSSGALLHSLPTPRAAKGDGETLSTDLQHLLGGSSQHCSHHIATFPMWCGYPEPPSSLAHMLPPPSLSRFLSVQNRWAQAVWEPPPFPPQSLRKDASPEQGAVPSRLRHSTLFRGAGKSLTRLSFSSGG